MTLEELKSTLEKFGTVKLVNEVLFSGKAVCFEKKEEIVWEIKERISRYFDMPIRNIEIVGSAKLGVSLNDERYGKLYNSRSDIDIVIVSSELFNLAWNDLLILNNSYYKLSQVQRDELINSNETIHRGFVSPDRLPKCGFKEMWWKIFNELSNKPKYEYRKIRGRLFLSWKFVESYYSIKIDKLHK